MGEARLGGIGLCAGLLCALLTASPALAQSSVPKPVGVKVGDGRLHPFLDVDGRYDSLVGFYSTDAAGRPVPSGELIIHVRPGLRFDLLTPSTMVAFNGAAEYLWMTGLLSPQSTNLSRFQANAGLDAHFNKDGPVEFQIGDSLIRSDRTQNAAAGVGVISLFNDLRVAVPIHPGGGALEITPRGSWQVEFFDPLLTGQVTGCTGDITCDPTRVQQMNYNNLQGALTGRWKFLPKTAIVLDASFDWRTYLTNPAANREAMLLKAQAGLVGLVSPRIAVTLLAGYTQDFAGSGLQTAIGQAELGYIPTENTRVAIGYLRTATPVPVFGTVGDDRGYLQARVGLLGGRLSLQGQAAVDFFSYYSQSGRSDLLVSANLGPQFDVTSWFQIGASYGLGMRASSVTALSAVNFVRHEAMLRLTLRY